MPLFEVLGLTHFFGGLKAVSDFNLTFEGGELVGLIGPNGAGKTTVFNLVCGVYHPTRGEVRIEGRSLARLYPHQVTAMGIARTFQNIRLWPEMTVLDNIRVAHNYRLSYGFLDVILQTHRHHIRYGWYWNGQFPEGSKGHRIREEDSILSAHGHRTLHA